MRFDFRRRQAQPTSPHPNSPFRSSPSSPFQTSSPSRWVATDRHRSPANSDHNAPTISNSSSTPPITSRPEYIKALEARMAQMEKVPTSSFYHSYAGEFDMLLAEDRKVTRKHNEFETSSRAENAYRNRYQNILSNEPTRVRLREVSAGENDYINANWVGGHGNHPGYIATQAPLPDTTPHFWQMVYESTSPVIIMLTRELEEDCHVAKSERYWPPVGQNVLFNDYLVLGIDEMAHDSLGVVERQFHVGRVVDKRRKHARDLVDADSLVAPAAENSMWQTPSRRRSFGGHCDEDDFDGDGEVDDLVHNLELIGPVVEVTQFQYVDWPDQDVPANPRTLLDICRRTDGLMHEQSAKNGGGVAGPVIVHCSAGVGRTGTFIAVDRTLRRLDEAFGRDSGQLVRVEEIRELVRKMKRERSKMVQTAEQYRFIYQAVLEGVKRGEMGEELFGERAHDGRPGGPADGAERERLRNGNGGAGR